jgi:hypothetical protein
MTEKNSPPKKQKEGGLRLSGREGVFYGLAPRRRAMLAQWL